MIHILSKAYEKELPKNIIQSFQEVLPRMQLKQADDRVDRVSYQSMLIVCQSIFYVASKPGERKPLRDYLSAIPENEFAFILLDCKNVWTEIQDELNGEYPHVLSFNQFVRECFLEAILVTVSLQFTLSTEYKNVLCMCMCTYMCVCVCVCINFSVNYPSLLLNSHEMLLYYFAAF